jgi:hypothetical protein
MKRTASLDLARGFTVLLITPIHCMLLYSKPEVYTSLIGQLFAFIAEGPGAPLFMMLMGISFALKENHRFSDVLKKAALLLLAGYGLNLIKFVIPYSGGWMPIGLKHDLQIPSTGGVWTLMGLGDILQFAAPALLILYGVTRFRFSACIAGALAITITWMAPLVWDAHSNNPLLNYMLQLATGQPPRTFFPIFPWLAYPMVGLVVGRVLQRDGPSCFSIFGQWGIALMGISAIFDWLYPNMPPTTFYRTYPVDTAGHVGIVLLALYFWDLLHRFVKSNHFFRVLTYSSKNITQIYLIQWVLISFLLPLVGYQKLGLTATILVIVPVAALVYVLSAFINVSRKTGLTF